MLEVIDGGPQSTVQDLGRPGYLHTGMPPSGAFDSFSLRVANLLVGNNPGGRYLVGRDPGDAGIEILLMGCRLRARLGRRRKCGGKTGEQQRDQVRVGHEPAIRSRTLVRQRAPHDGKAGSEAARVRRRAISSTRGTSVANPRVFCAT